MVTIIGTIKDSLVRMIMQGMLAFLMVYISLPPLYVFP